MLEWLFPWRRSPIVPPHEVEQELQRKGKERQALANAIAAHRKVEGEARDEQVGSVLTLLQRTVGDRVTERGTELQDMVKATLSKARGE